MKGYSPRCRSCSAGSLVTILSYGQMPLANALLSADDLERPEPTYPLDLAFCPDCALLQINETVPPEQLFREYLYFSSYSDTMLRHAEALAGRLIDQRTLTDSSLVVEIASNDGYLLQYYQQAGIPVLGIEPAVNVARAAQDERGIRTLTEFFDLGLARQLSSAGERADILHAHNVMAHVADLNGFVAGLPVLLKAEGIAVIEVPYVKDLLDRLEFDTVYHEHLCYFSLTAIDQLFERHGLVLVNVQWVPIHGGSLRLFAARRRSGTTVCERGPAVTALLAEEAAWNVDQPEP